MIFVVELKVENYDHIVSIKLLKIDLTMEPEDLASEIERILAFDIEVSG